MSDNDGNKSQLSEYIKTMRGPGFLGTGATSLSDFPCIGYGFKLGLMGGVSGFAIGMLITSRTVTAMKFFYAGFCGSYSLSFGYCLNEHRKVMSERLQQPIEEEKLMEAAFNDYIAIPHGDEASTYFDNMDKKRRLNAQKMAEDFKKKYDVK